MAIDQGEPSAGAGRGGVTPQLLPQDLVHQRRALLGVGNRARHAVEERHLGAAGVAAGLGVIHLFERRSLRLFLIDGTYLVLAFTVIGAVLGAWH